MPTFRNLTPVNGFDSNNLNNARQNNYAWSMSDLGDFIYVGTGRNILLNIIAGINSAIKTPILLNPDPVDNLAEIWRFRKDERLPWERVYKAQPGSGIFGFRYMIQHNPLGVGPCLYAASYGNMVKILKSTNGVNWFILPGDLEGTSSRAMISHNGKLYVSTVNEIGSSTDALLYRSSDPEFYPWELVIDKNAPGFDPEKNPRGAISNMAVFNDRIYVATSNADGVQVWRTNGAEPALNDWTLVVGNGFGDPANKYSLAIGVFKDHLYVSGTKKLPLSWFIPRGCDVVRIDKRDNWELIVGGNPLISLSDSKPEEKCRAGIGSGFNNPFNVYAWQIQEFQGKLLISTFDDSSNMGVILTTLLTNRVALAQLIGEEITELLIDVYGAVVEILRAIRYPIGFDLYVSNDGVSFNSIFLNGLKNPNNYGGRILYPGGYRSLYVGTANPFQGCEVWKACDFADLYRPYLNKDYINLWRARSIMQENYRIIEENMLAILKFIPAKYYQNFI
ncbi:MAG: hypothetical protein WCP73_02370 [Eubacteriales bacterium]